MEAIITSIEHHAKITGYECFFFELDNGVKGMVRSRNNYLPVMVGDKVSATDRGEYYTLTLLSRLSNASETAGDREEAEEVVPGW